MNYSTIAKHYSRFRRSEDGAVTVDWVVIVAGVVGLAIAAFTVVETQTTGLADATGQYVGERAN